MAQRIAVKRPPVPMPVVRLTIALCFVSVAALSIPAGRVTLAYWLPSEMPVRWDGRGVAELVPASTVLLWCLGIALAGLLLAAAALALPRAGFFVQRAILLAGAIVTGLAAAAWWILASLALRAISPASPETAPRPSAELLWAGLGIVILVLAVTVAAGPRPGRKNGSRPPVPELPRVALPAEGPRVWERDLFAGFFLVPGCLIAVTGAAMVTVSPTVSVICFLFALFSFTVLHTRLRIDDRGVSVRPWFLPRGLVITYERIGEATAETVNPWRPGMGRSQVFPSESGLWLRKGPACVLRLADGRRRAFMMSEPEVAAGLVNAHLDRLRAAARQGLL